MKIATELVTSNSLAEPADEPLVELPCAVCRELNADAFLVYVDTCTELPFAGEVCARCLAELVAEQEKAR